MISQGSATEVLLSQGTDAAGQPLTQDSIFWLGSNSKMLTAATLLQLEAAGRLTLHDPVGKHIPGWSDKDLTKDGESCTIARLLSHQCGLPTNAPLPRYAALADPVRRTEVREAFLDYVRNTPLQFTPGADYRYSNVGYTLAGLIAQQHDTGSFGEVAARRLFKPAGLQHTGFAPEQIPGFSKKVAPLSVNLGPWALSTRTWLGLAETTPAWHGPAGGGFSTPADYSQLITALFAGTALPPAQRTELTTPRSKTKGEASSPDYGLGVGVAHIDGQTQFQHGGALEPHGFSTHMIHLPAEGLTLIVMSNRGLSVYDARAVNNALLAVIRGGPYVSPFPSGVGPWLGASAIGITHLIVVPLLFLSMLFTAVRPTKNGRMGLAAGLAIRAWAILFIRGLLGIHTGDAHVLLLSGALLAAVLLVLGYRLRRQPQMPRLPPKRPWLGRTRTWAFMLCSAAVMLFVALLVQLFTVQTLLLLAMAAGFVAWPRRSRAQPNQEALAAPS